MDTQTGLYIPIYNVYGIYRHHYLLYRYVYTYSLYIPLTTLKWLCRTRPAQDWKMRLTEEQRSRRHPSSVGRVAIALKTSLRRTFKQHHKRGKNAGQASEVVTWGY